MIEVNFLKKLYKRVGVDSDRTQNIIWHLVNSAKYKVGTVLVNMFLTRVAIKYLDVENYGIWLTLASFLSWISLFDIGLGNGLRNKIIQANAKSDNTSIRGYVSTAYFLMASICIGLIFLFTSLSFLIDWSNFFKASIGLRKTLNILIPIVFGLFCVQLVLKLIFVIYSADENHSMQSKVNFYSQTASFLLILFIPNNVQNPLFVFGLLISLVPTVILLFFNFYTFSIFYFKFRPSIKYFNKRYLKDIFSVGIIYFFIQLSGVVLFSTDNFIITTFFSPSEVVPYNIALNYFTIVVMVFSTISAPYVSSICNAYANSDFIWIEKSMKILKKISFLLFFVIIVMVISSDFVYKIWIGDDVKISFSLTLLMGGFISASILVTPYTVFLNGTGKIKLQAIQAISSAIINIPLSIYLCQIDCLGSNGVILATLICFTPSMIINPIQYKKIITNNARKIWNK